MISNSVEKVEAGTKLVDEAGATMQEIVASVARVTDIMAEITAASQEQTSGIEQVNQAITQMDQATQQNASLVEEAAAAAESMQGQSRHLAQVVSVFKLDNMGTAIAESRTQERSISRTKATITSLPERIAAKSTPVIASPRPRRVANTRSANAAEWEQF